MNELSSVDLEVKEIRSQWAKRPKVCRCSCARTVRCARNKLPIKCAKQCDKAKTKSEREQLSV